MSGNLNIWPNRLYNKGKYYRKHNDKHNDKRTNPPGRHYILNRYAQITSKYMKEKLIELKGERDKSTNIFGNFNTLFSSIIELETENKDWYICELKEKAKGSDWLI